jgi:hypothetical protein
MSMFGAFKFDPLKIDPVFVEAVRAAMAEAEAKLPGKSGADKREWVRAKVAVEAKKLSLKSVPEWLQDIVRDAVVYVVIEVIWALFFRKNAPCKS